MDFVSESGQTSDLKYTNRANHSREIEVATQSVDYYAPIAVTFFSALSTLAVFYFIATASEQSKKRNWKLKRFYGAVAGESRNFEKSTVLPGYGILGDRVNEVIELFLDALAIYVHNDGSRDCPRRMLCEANQRAADYGMGYGILTYMLSLSVSFLLRGQRVSESMEAMRRGRHGMDCKYSYPRCPYSL